MSKSKHVVLIHGNFTNNLTWENWKKRYEQRGYTVHAPANPGHEGVPAELRKQVHPQLAGAGLREVVQNIQDLIANLPEPPVVIGHSMARLAVMKLVESGRVAAGISINGAPPKNVQAPFKTIKTVFPSFLLFSSKKHWLGSPKWFNKAFFNTLPPAKQALAYEKYIVPESKKVSWDALTTSFAKVDFKQPHVPMLFIGGGKDQIFSANFTQKIAGNYQQPVDLKIFDNKSHFICGEPGWEAVADYILDWYEKQPEEA